MLSSSSESVSAISFTKTSQSGNEQQLRTSEASIGSVQHSEATPGAGVEVEYVALHFQHDGSGDERSNNSFEVSSSLDFSKEETIKDSQSYPRIQVNKKSVDVKESPFEGISEPPSIISCEKTSVATATYHQQPFTEMQQVQLRAQILVHGSLMKNSVPEEAWMISAFAKMDYGRCLWESAWRACNERIHPQQSQGSNLETPVQSCSSSRGPDQSVKNNSLESRTPSPAGKASSKGIPSQVVNPSIPILPPLWNLSTPFDGLQSSSAFAHYHQPYAPMQLYHVPHIEGFVEQSSFWLSQMPFARMTSPQISPLDINAHVSLFPGTEALEFSPPNVSSIPNHPAVKQATQLPVSTNGEVVGVSFETSSQTHVNKVTVRSGQNSANPKPKKRKKFPVSTSSEQVPLLTVNQAASVSDASNHLSEKVNATQSLFQKSLLAQNLPEMGSPFVNVLSTSISGTAACFASTSNSDNNLEPISSTLVSNQPTRVDQIVEKKDTLSEETLNAVNVARLQAEDAAAHAAAAVSNCNDVWSHLNKLKNSGLRCDDETKLSSAAMAIAAAASVAKAAAKLASNVAVETKLMADEVSIKTVTENSTHSSAMSPSRASSSSPLAGKGKISSSSVIAVAKEAVKKRVEAASASAKHAENLDAIVKASELAAAAVSQAGIIVCIGNHLPLRQLADLGPMNYWSTLHASPEWGAHIDQSKTRIPEKLVPAELPKVGANIMGEAVYPGTITSNMKNSSRTQRCHRASDTARTIDTVSEYYCGTNSEAVASEDAYRTASGISFENEMLEGCLVEVFKGGGTRKEAWYLAKIINLEDGKAFVCYTELQTNDGSGNLKEWVPLNGDGFKAPIVRTAHPTTSMGFDGTTKRRRAAVIDYTWCVGDRVDAWMQDCWLEGFVKEKNKDDETTLTIYFPALGDTFAMKMWHLRPARTWQDGKWIEWPTASRKSPSQVGNLNGQQGLEEFGS